MNYPNPKDNPARQALTRAVNRAIANGAPVYVNQPAKTKTAKQAAYLFFLRNAGFSYNPKTETKSKGRSRCARDLAKAERDAKALGYWFDWDTEQDGCTGCSCESHACKCSTHEPHKTLQCLMIHPDGHFVQSLGGICEPTREYRRVVEAELALEEVGK